MRSVLFGRDQNVWKLEVHVKIHGYPKKTQNLTQVAGLEIESWRRRFLSFTLVSASFLFLSSFSFPFLVFFFVAPVCWCWCVCVWFCEVVWFWVVRVVLLRLCWCCLECLQFVFCVVVGGLQWCWWLRCDFGIYVMLLLICDSGLWLLLLWQMIVVVWNGFEVSGGCGSVIWRGKTRVCIVLFFWWLLMNFLLPPLNFDFWFYNPSVRVLVLTWG
jgi:hypothetical protein